MSGNKDVTLYYVYQDPIIAWQFTKAREDKEGRVVPKERFINAYFKSRENIKEVKETFGDKVELNIVMNTSVALIKLDDSKYWE
ncbi:MAG: zeta toxin family protein [Sporolactobacillus sp.]